MINKPARKFPTRNAPRKPGASRFPLPPKKEIPETVEKKAAPKKRNLSFDDIKQQLASWIENEHIPGKFQAWFTEDAKAENADWRIFNKVTEDNFILNIDSPAFGMEPPDVVVQIFEQLKKDHLKAFRKSIRSIWFRATGDGRYALVVQANLRGKNSAHANKTFVDFVQRSCPEIISCHQIQCMPNIPFDPTIKQAARVESKCSFGNDFMPLAGTGFYMHVLDWAPRIKDAWLKLPSRIAEAIHPAKGDKLFEFYSASSFVSTSLASQFQQVEALDCRETAMESSRLNARSLVGNNFRFHRGILAPAIFTKFFSKEENEGRWTFYFNIPNEEPFAPGMEQVIAGSRPERILLQTGNLESASKLIKRFRNEGYLLRKSIPLYLEPGSGNFEILMLFVPDRAGLLGAAAAVKGKSRTVQKPKELPEASKSTNKPLFVQKIPTFKQRKF